MVCPRCGYQNTRESRCCSQCGNMLCAKKAKTLPTIIIFASIVVAALCIGAVLGPLFHVHTWTGGTCINPMICSECGQTGAYALGHDWKPATCTSPKTCDECGETEGRALGHNWRGATCTTPEMCEDCGTIEGVSLGHDWIEATYDAPETCRRCHNTRGGPLVREEQDQQQIVSNAGQIGAGGVHTVVMKPDGTAIGCGDPGKPGAYDVEDWTDLISVGCGDFYSLGLHSDGTVSITGVDWESRCDVESWYGITAIAAGDFHAVGLRNDGTVVAVGVNETQMPAHLTGKRLNVSRLNNQVTADKKIIAIAASFDHTVALYSDGTVLAVGDNQYGQCNTNGWAGIIAIYAGVKYTMGMRSDGSLLYTGDSYVDKYEVESWRDVVMLSAGDYHVVAVTKDGRILTEMAKAKHDKGQCDLHSWDGYDIVTIGAGCRHTVAITSDGIILARGENTFSQCEINGMRIEHLP